MVCLAALIPAHAQTLDPTFGSGGIITNVPLPEGFTTGNARLLSLGNGKFVLSVSVSTGDPFNEDIAVMRYTGKGILDQRFGQDGITVFDWGSASLDAVTAGLARDQYKRIIVVGQTGLQSVDTNPAIAVLTGAGQLDATFSGDGVLIVPDGVLTALPRTVLIDRQNRIVFDAAVGGGCCTRISAALMRVLSDGTPDTAPAPVGSGAATSLALDSSGRFIWAHAAEYLDRIELVLERLMPDGQPDTTFNGGVPVSETLMFIAHPSIRLAKVATQSTGAIVLAGGLGGAFHAWRYTPDGAKDLSFGSGGHVSVPVISGELVTALIDAQDRIMLIGSAFTGTSRDFVIVRLTPDGALDTSFNGTGMFSVDIAGISDDMVRDAILMPDGDVIIAGDINGIVAVGVVRIDIATPETLVVNGGFETGDKTQASKSQAWPGKALTKDKRKCAPKVIPHTGNCAFVFKGSASEKSSISQTIKLPAALRVPGIALALGAWAVGEGMALGKVVITYTDGTSDAFSVAISGGLTYQRTESAPYILGKAAKKVKVMFRFTGTSGTLALDDVTLLPNTLRGLPPAPLPIVGGSEGR